MTWTAGSVPALALLPSTIAGLWAGHSLWRLEQLIPRVVSGVAVGDSIAHGLRHGPLAGLLGAIARLLLLTAVLSAALLLTPWLDSRAGVLLAFGLLALATLLASLLEALGRAHWAVAGVAGGVIVELLAPPAFPGAPLTLGAAVTVLVLLGPALALLARPARTLATALWIT